MWNNNKMDGFGVFEWPDGRKFSGQYKDNEKHGKGIFEWPDRRKFIGQWMNGLQEGEGVFIGSLGSIRKGEWKKGERVQWVKAEQLDEKAREIIEFVGRNC